MSNYLSGFKCVACSKNFSAQYTKYSCETCGNNLDIQYDYDSISSEFSVNKLKSDHNMNIWRYEPLFPINALLLTPDIEMALSPLYRIKDEKSEVYFKDDTRQPSGSFKDRAGAVVMTVAREKGFSTLTCASTGNAGSSWACMGASAGMKVIVYIPKTAPRAKLAQIKVYGAELRLVDGNYDAAYDLCMRESVENGYFNRSTGYNPYTREGKKSVSFEIWEQLGYRVPGTVIVPVGDGNILSGVYKGFNDLKELGLIQTIPELIAVQSENSDALARTFAAYNSNNSLTKTIEIIKVEASTRADSISVDLPRDGVAAIKAVLGSNGKFVTLTDAEIINSISDIASSIGVFAEPAGAASLAAWNKIKSSEDIKNIKYPVVNLITGNGLKDIEAVLN